MEPTASFDAAGSVAVPVDLSGWFTGDPTEMDRVAAEVDEACATSGFLSITGHQVPRELMDGMLAVSQAFFDLPTEEKLRYRLEDVAANRGYAPFESEALSYSLGLESEPDLFEAFNVGREVVPDGVSDDVARTYFSTNVWPDEPAELRGIYLRYWDACEELGHVLCDVFARALGLPAGYFEPYLDRTPSVMRANNYQRRSGHQPSNTQLRMGAHSDYGSLTILLADPVPGLQMRDRNGLFHDVIPQEGAFLVNLGDLLAEWTNDRWRSTIHRVVPPPVTEPGEARRRSVAWFQQPNHDAVIRVLDVCCDADNPPRYPETTSGEHLMAKLMGPRAGQDVEVDDAFMAPLD
ncbi:MAG: 2-oxoglutarate and iron-dependent oxygenase domain-containing protein [Actinomycetota bacterium]